MRARVLVALGLLSAAACASAASAGDAASDARALLDLKHSITNFDDFKTANRLAGWDDDAAAGRGAGDDDDAAAGRGAGDDDDDDDDAHRARGAACSWTGVTCDEDGRVVELNLDCAALACRVKAAGPLPPTLADLTALRRLVLSNQSFRGPLPPAWGAPGAFPALHTLDLSLNHLSGALPAWGGAGVLPSLAVLALARNELSGGLPAAWGALPSLRRVALYHNGLSGVVPPALRASNATLWLKPGNYLLCGAGDARNASAGAPAATTSPSFHVCSVDGAAATALPPANLTDAQCRRVPSLGKACPSSTAPPTKAAMPAARGRGGGWEGGSGGADAALGAVLRLRGDLLPFGPTRAADVEAALTTLLPGVTSRRAIAVTQALEVEEGGDEARARRRRRLAQAAAAPPPSDLTLTPLVPGDAGPADTALPPPPSPSTGAPPRDAVDVSVRVLLASAAPDAAASLERALLAAAESGALLAALKKEGLSVDGVQLLVTLPLQPEPLTAADAALAGRGGGGGGRGGAIRRPALVAAVVLSAALAGLLAGVAGWVGVRAVAAGRAKVAAAAAGGKPGATAAPVATALGSAGSGASKVAAVGSGDSAAVSVTATATRPSRGGAPPPSPPPSTIAEADLTIALRPDGSPWLLGEGAYGRVYRGTLRGVQPVAVKALHAGGDAAPFAAECALLQTIRCPNVVQFLGVCASPSAGALLVTEFCGGGDLFRALARPNAATLFAWPKWGRRVAADVARGLAFLHSARVVHFDLKSQNVLLTSTGDAKIADVGLARLRAASYIARTDGVIGTLSHSAPELILGLRCTEKADIYSLGVTLWEIITRERPVRGQMRDVSPDGDGVPADVAALVRSCLDPDPKARPTAREVYEVIVGGSVGAGGRGGGDVSIEAATAATAAAAQPHAAGPPPPAPLPPSASSSDGAAPPTPFAVACQSPFATQAPPGRDAGAALARRVAAAARAALGRAKRKQRGQAEEEEEEEEEDGRVVVAFL